MPSSNKPATTTTKQERSPWAPAVGNLQTVLDRSADLAGTSSNWVPTYSQSTMGGIGGLEGYASTIAQNGSSAARALDPVVSGSVGGFGAGLGQLSQVAGGGYLNANPYLDQALSAGRDAVANKVNSVFSGAGRYGSAAHTGALTRELGNLESQARMGQYNQERTAQDSAARALYGGGFQGAGMGGALDAANLTPYQLMLQAGALRDQQSEQERTAPMRSTEWLAQMTNPIASMGGRTEGTQTTVQPTNRMSQIMGGVQMGLGLLAAPMTGGMSLIGAGNGLMNMMGGGGGYTAPPSYRGSWGNLVGGV